MNLRALCFALVWFLAGPSLIAQEPSDKPVAGKADVLREIPKRFGHLLEVDLAKHTITLQLDGDQKATTWMASPDAEFKIHGWWGRLDQFKANDRVWIWFAIDRRKNPSGILMMADELSEQHIHGILHKVIAVNKEDGRVTVESAVAGERELMFSSDEVTLEPTKEVFLQTTGDKIRKAVDRESFQKLQAVQREELRERWRSNGLPGTVTFLHPVSGEMELSLDHESARWGRYLKNGDAVTITIEDPIKAVVKHIKPWREKTVVRLVTNSGVDQFDLKLGQRVHTLVPEPPADVQASQYPSDVGRWTDREGRIDWFLASLYCPCKIAGDQCTGMFYTLASCNVNSCGMPNQIRELIGGMIDDGLADEQIWTKLKEMRGNQITHQHLLR